jgi:hypothetical protein
MLSKHEKTAIGLMFDATELIERILTLRPILPSRMGLEREPESG